jgi:hypothetical protein
MAFNPAEMISNAPKAIIDPYTYSIAFFVPKLCTVDNITMFVGPGVKVTIMQYIKKDVKFMIHLLFKVLS